MKYTEKYKLANQETIGSMGKINVEWWEKVGKHIDNPRKRKEYFQRFLSNISKNVPGWQISNYCNSTVGEACGGPYGGIIDLYLPKSTKYQIDLYADDYSKFGWIKNPSNTQWINSPCEDIDLADNKLDFLIAYNSLDHGWDIKQAIRECVRVSRECMISFDCNRYKLPGYPDLYHYQKVDFEEVTQFMDEQFNNANYDYKRWSFDSEVPVEGQNKISRFTRGLKKLKLLKNPPEYFYVKVLEFYIKKKSCFF